jgi:hypothetical protein
VASVWNICRVQNSARKMPHAKWMRAARISARRWLFGEHGRLEAAHFQDFFAASEGGHECLGDLRVS